MKILTNIAVLILMDIVLNWVDPLGMNYFSEANRYFKNAMRPDSNYFYIHKPGHIANYQGVQVKINSRGLRCPEGRADLLILGDSVVFGWGVEQDKIFPAYFDCVAAGVGSWNTVAECEWLHREGMRFNPRVVLLVVTSNDAEVKTPYRRGGRSVLLRSYFVRCIRYMVRLSAREPDWLSARNALAQIAIFCGWREIELVVCLYAPGPGNPALDKYADYLKRIRVKYFYLPAELFQRKYHNRLIDKHANAEGHRIIAEEIKRYLPDVRKDRSF